MCTREHNMEVIVCAKDVSACERGDGSSGVRGE